MESVINTHPFKLLPGVQICTTDMFLEIKDCLGGFAPEAEFFGFKTNYMGVKEKKIHYFNGASFHVIGLAYGS